MACHSPKHCAYAQQGLERLLQSVDQRLADLDTSRESPSDDAPLSAAAAVPTMLTDGSAMASEPSMPSTPGMQQQQQGAEEEGGRQAAYEQMQVSF